MLRGRAPAPDRSIPDRSHDHPSRKPTYRNEMKKELCTHKEQTTLLGSHDLRMSSPQNDRSRRYCSGDEHHSPTPLCRVECDYRYTQVIEVVARRATTSRFDTNALSRSGEGVHANTTTTSAHLCRTGDGLLTMTSKKTLSVPGRGRQRRVTVRISG